MFLLWLLLLLLLWWRRIWSRGRSQPGCCVPGWPTDNSAASTCWVAEARANRSTCSTVVQRTRRSLNSAHGSRDLNWTVASAEWAAASAAAAATLCAGCAVHFVQRTVVRMRYGVNYDVKGSTTAKNVFILNIRAACIECGGSCPPASVAPPRMLHFTRSMRCIILLISR